MCFAGIHVRRDRGLLSFVFCWNLFTHGSLVGFICDLRESIYVRVFGCFHLCRLGNHLAYGPFVDFMCVLRESVYVRIVGCFHLYSVGIILSTDRWSASFVMCGNQLTHGSLVGVICVLR